MKIKKSFIREDVVNIEYDEEKLKKYMDFFKSLWGDWVDENEVLKTISGLILDGTIESGSDYIEGLTMYDLGLSWELDKGFIEEED